MSGNRTARGLRKVIQVTRRDGVTIMLTKVANQARFTVAQSSWWRSLKRAVPSQIKEYLRQKQEPVFALVEQSPLPPGDPLAAVIIPCYNYGKYLPEAIESAQNQTLGNIEIIVVDDGSNDPLTIKLLDELALNSSVKLIRQPNKGLSAARNTGIRATNARYITCLDADDLIDPTYLEKAVMVLETRPDLGLAYPLAQLFGDFEEIWYTEPLDPGKLLQYNHIPVVAVYRRAIWEKVGGYDESMRIGYEDWDFWLRLAGEGYGGYLIREPLFKHRRHGKTMTHSAQEKHGQLKDELLKKHARVARVKRLPGVEVRPEQAFLNFTGAPGLVGQRRLLVLVPWLKVGGAETVLLQVLKAFSASKHWQVYLVTTLDSANEWLDLFLAVTPHIFILPHLFRRRYFIDYLNSFVTAHAIDAILNSHSELAYLSLEGIRKVAPALPILDLLHNDTPEGYAKLSAQMDRYLSGHIVVHGGIKNTLLEKFGLAEEKIHIIPNGVNQERFKPGEADRTAVAAQNSQAGGTARVAYIGRLSKEKNPLLFIKAAGRLQNLKGVEWFCYGDGILEAEMQTVAADHQAQVRFMGACVDTAQVLRTIDLLVLTSDAEGLPMIVLEALSCGAPVVATNVGNLAEVVQEGVNGHLVPKGDLNALCAVLERLLSQPGQLEQLKQNCRASVLEKFSGERMARSYVKLYDHLLS
ncbi:MAG: glycosyltransferase [Desulfotomaculaceae bacterium]|nr:glycosyltransferase [Desulfotomaculaceae bacterium]MDD4766379.1 glycosyltransferase [Desulfotomaculaceae bacterium]